MAAAQLDFDRAIPDRTSTDGLSPVEAAEVDFLAGRPHRWSEPRAGVHPAVTARALVVADRVADAREVLSAAGEHRWSPQGLAAAGWCASRVWVPGLTDALRDELAAHEPGSWIEQGIPLCTTSGLHALLAVAEGDLDSAIGGFGDAVRQGDLRAPVWGAIARLEMARVQLSLAHTTEVDTRRTPPGTPGLVADHPRAAAKRQLTAARTFFASAGYEHLRRVSEDLLAQTTVSPPGPTPAAQRQPGVAPLVVAASPTLGTLIPPGISGHSNWTVGFGVQPAVEVRPRRGLVALAHLVANRDRAVPAVEIAQILHDHRPDPRAGDPPDADDPGTASSAEAREQIARLSQIRLDDCSQPAQLAEEVRDLVFDERQRSRVSKLLRRTITSLRTEHRLLAEHLGPRVSTGYLCSYAAPPEVRWIP